MNHITELIYTDKFPKPPPLQKLNAFQYVDLNSGEIKQYNKTDNRSQSYSSLRKTFNNLARLINYNVNPDYMLMLTLTYRQRDNLNDDPKPMRDENRLYKDLKSIKQGLKYQYKDIEYIDVREPQQSGSYHSHLILLFKNKYPFIPVKLIDKLWPHGFYKISTGKEYQDVDNIGAYFIAYFTDIPAPDKVPKHLQPFIKKSAKNGKKYLKGERLKYYPPGFNIYTTSKGIKHPKPEKITYKDLMKKSLGKVTFKKSYDIIKDDEGSWELVNSITKIYYNSKR